MKTLGFLIYAIIETLEFLIYAIMETLELFSYAIMETLEFFSYAIMETLEFFSYVILKTLGFLRRLLVIYKKLLMEKLFFKGCNGIMCLSTTMEKGLTLVSSDVGFKKLGKIKTDIIIPH